jgi:lipopolysaccharide transport system ATP-binding protein
VSTANTAIRVEGLGKCYRIGEAAAAYGLLRETLADIVSKSIRGGRRPASANKEEFWALRDVSFEVKQAEVVGIIGGNGAGKSTLLKILSRITEPTVGKVRMRGRVQSLLEVGTGFHPELTGRENIYLNGAILGMKRSDTQRKFDQIVDFAEIEQFIDTPVKRYSSGMYTRLAFSIAAHLEPDILIVDEVLAVGDAAFQKKSLSKMNSAAQEGRTILFVTHNLGLVQALCTRGILLRNGAIVADATAVHAVSTYLAHLEVVSQGDVALRGERGGAGRIRLTRLEVSGADGQPSSVLAAGRPARFTFHVSEVRSGMSCSLTIYDSLGQPVTFFDSLRHGTDDRTASGPGQRIVCEIEELLLLPGRYRLNAAIMHNGELQDHLEAAVFLDVEQGEVRGRPLVGEPGYGSAFIPHRWVLPRTGQGGR